MLWDLVQKRLKRLKVPKGSPTRAWIPPQGGHIPRFLPPYGEEDEFVVVDPQTMKRRLAEELAVYNLTPDDMRNFSNNQNQALGESPATLTLTKVHGSNMFASFGQNFGFLSAFASPAASAPGSLPSSAANIPVENMLAVEVLDLAVDQLVYDRSPALDIEKKDKVELEKAKNTLIESDNSTTVSGISVEFTPVNREAAPSSNFSAARSNSSMRISTNVGPSNPGESSGGLRVNTNFGANKPPVNQFDPGEECKAIAQETQQSLIEFQRKSEASLRKAQKFNAMSRGVTIMAKAAIATRVKAADEKPASNEQENVATAMPPSATPPASPEERRADAGADNAMAPSPPPPTVSAFSKRTVQEYIKEKSKQKKKDPVKNLPAQVTQVAKNESNYGTKSSDKMSTTVYGNLAVVERQVGFVKDKKGKPNLKKKKTEAVKLSEMASGLPAGKYNLKTYENEEAGITSKKQLKKTAKTFEVKSSSKKDSDSGTMLDENQLLDE